MTELGIVAVDPFDATSFEPWWRAYHDAEAHDRGPNATIWQLEELRAQMQDDGRRMWTAAWSGIVDGEVVSTGTLGTPLLDNLDRADLAVTTVAGHRRRGHATAMLGHVEQVARARGRTVIGGEAYWPHEAGPDGAGASGREFARAGATRSPSATSTGGSRCRWPTGCSTSSLPRRPVTTRRTRCGRGWARRRTTSSTTSPTSWRA